MGQEEIINLLEKAKTPLSRTQIAEMLKETPIKISLLIKRIFKDPHTEVKCIEINRLQAMKFYNCKRRMRLYFIDDKK